MTIPKRWAHDIETELLLVSAVLYLCLFGFILLLLNFRIGQIFLNKNNLLNLIFSVLRDQNHLAQAYWRPGIMYTISQLAQRSMIKFIDLSRARRTLCFEHNWSHWALWLNILTLNLDIITPASISLSAFLFNLLYTYFYLVSPPIETWQHILVYPMLQILNKPMICLCQLMGLPFQFIITFCAFLNSHSLSTFQIWVEWNVPLTVLCNKDNFSRKQWGVLFHMTEKSQLCIVSKGLGQLSISVVSP